MALRINETPAVAPTPEMIMGMTSPINFNRGQAKKHVHTFIDVAFGCVAEKMEVISHENEAMNRKIVFFVQAMKQFDHDGPDFIERYRKEFLVITSRSDVIRMDLRANEKRARHIRLLEGECRFFFVLNRVMNQDVQDHQGAQKRQ